MTRLGAFLVHLGISLVIFAVLAALVAYVWYPDFFFSTDGGWQGIRIIVLVDLVLGPLLTLIVFNRNKPWPVLRKDLTMIAVFQIACLTAGTYVVYSERPLALVYVDGSFYSMSADAYAEAGVDVPDLSSFPGPWPKRVVVDLPEDPAEQSELRVAALRQRIPLRAVTELYQPLTRRHLNAAEEAFDQKTLVLADPLRRQIDGWVSEHGGKLADFDFFPYGARYARVYIGVSRDDGKIAGLLSLDQMPEMNYAQEKPLISQEDNG